MKHTKLASNGYCYPKGEIFLKMPIDADIPTDVEIVRQVVDGDVNAFELLLKRYQDHVLKIVKKHVPYEQIEETAHDVFVRAYQSLPTYKNKSYFKHWLSSIAVRTCYDFWRKQYRSRELPMSSLSEKQQHWLETTISDQSSQSFYEQGVQQEAKDVLDWALSTLSAEDRMVMELVYLEGLSGKEAAKLLGWSVTNVKVRVFRCRKKLQKLLTKEFNLKSSQNLSGLERLDSPLEEGNRLDSPLEGGKGGVNSV